MKCVNCGRRLLRAAAYLPAVETGPMPHPAGAVGRTCARRAGLLPPSLFERRRAVVRVKKSRRDAAQLELQP